MSVVNYSGSLYVALITLLAMHWHIVHNSERSQNLDRSFRIFI